MTMEMADHLLEHLREMTEFLESLDAPLPGPDTTSAPRSRTETLKVSRIGADEPGTRAVRSGFASGRHLTDSRRVAAGEVVRAPPPAAAPPR